MNELLAAAKAVIDHWHKPLGSGLGKCVDDLRAAVERAEKQESVGFAEWWDKNADLKYKFVPIGQAKQLWNDATTAATQAERERSRARAQMAAEQVWKAGDLYIGPQHSNLAKFIDALLEDGDE